MVWNPIMPNWTPKSQCWKKTHTSFKSMKKMLQIPIHCQRLISWMKISHVNYTKQPKETKNLLDHHWQSHSHRACCPSPCMLVGCPLPPSGIQLQHKDNPTVDSFGSRQQKQMMQSLQLWSQFQCSSFYQHLQNFLPHSIKKITALFLLDPQHKGDGSELVFEL